MLVITFSDFSEETLCQNKCAFVIHDLLIQSVMKIAADEFIQDIYELLITRAKLIPQ